MKYPLDSKSESLLNIAIVGGGPAGMQATLSAAKLGHTVTIFEAKETLGGLLSAAATPHISQRVEKCFKNTPTT